MSRKQQSGLNLVSQACVFSFFLLPFLLLFLLPLSLLPSFSEMESCCVAQTGLKPTVLQLGLQVCTIRSGSSLLSFYKEDGTWIQLIFIQMEPSFYSFQECGRTRCQPFKDIFTLDFCSEVSETPKESFCASVPSRCFWLFHSACLSPWEEGLVELNTRVKMRSVQNTK